MTPQEINDWLATIPADAHIGMDEGGLTLVAHDPAGKLLGYLEVGGYDQTWENP